MVNFLFYLSLFLIWFMLVYHMFLMQGGYMHFLRYQKKADLWEKRMAYYPKVSIIIPAHNEEVVIENTIEAMIRLKYPRKRLELIIVNDNSTDNTGSIINKYARAYSFIKAIHTKPPYAGRGKSGALNSGLVAATGEYIVVYDADNQPEEDAVYYLAQALQNDQKAGAVDGKFRVLNANKNMLTSFINIETITFQWLAQAGRWFWFKLTTIPGTNFAIRRSILEELGGWDERALSEDTELSIRVYNLGYHIRFFPAAITWEQEPETFKVWWKQRTRWARGNQYVILKFLIQFFQLKNKKVYLDLFYFLFTYMLFLAGVLVSNLLFVLNLFMDLDISAGGISLVLLVLAFLLYMTEIMLALSIEKEQATFKNMLAVILMYFTYSQIWLALVVYSLYLEAKRVLLKQDVVWYKTQRYKQTS